MGHETHAETAQLLPYIWLSGDAWSLLTDESEHFVRREKIDPNQSQELFGVPPSEFPGSVALEISPGDVVIFQHDLYHAAFGGGERRRMFTMNCTRRAKTADDFAILRQYLSRHSPGTHNIDTGAGMFYPTILDPADDKRMIHLQQSMELHDELLPQFARQKG
ncbi:hypothetical protein KFU94_67455 [Chloroflexi bacterium TSY]|nr:hypothetical protein [Chloroflexi bacterium TSY]